VPEVGRSSRVGRATDSARIVAAEAADVVYVAPMETSREPQATEATVVVVDDEPALLEIISIALGTAGPFDVVGRARDGREALAVIEEHQPDIVLLDLILGAERGVDLVSPLMRASPRTMIAALTALPAEAEEASTLRAGCFVFYEKGMLTSLPGYLQTDLELFRRALRGEDVVAPSALVRRPRTTPPIGVEVDLDDR
jgi:DNA-binding NarL/FixJ family response regulator